MDKITLNLGGRPFYVRKSLLARQPGTLLSELTEDSDYYDPVDEEFFFDRSPTVFHYVLEYYRTGELHVPREECLHYVECEFAFWGLGKDSVAPCCWRKYLEETQELRCRAEMEAVLLEQSRRKEACRKVARSEDFLTRWRGRIWMILSEPTSCLPAKLYTAFILFLIVFTMSITVTESMRHFRILAQHQHPNSTDPKLQGRAAVYWNTLRHPYVNIADVICAAFFSLDMCLRCVTAPDLSKLVKTVIFWLEWLSLLANWWFCITNSLVSLIHLPVEALLTLIALRTCRMFTAFKMANQVPAVRLMNMGLYSSAKELLLLVGVIFMSILVFGILAFHVELTYHTSFFVDIPVSLWWALVTLTTVGYGDLYPISVGGYIVSAVCVFTGMIITSLTFPIIAENFSKYYCCYKEAKNVPKDAAKKIARVKPTLKQEASDCPNRHSHRSYITTEL